MQRQPREDIESIKKQLQDSIRENNRFKQMIRSRNKKIGNLQEKMHGLTLDYNDLYSQFQMLDLRQVEPHLVQRFRNRYYQCLKVKSQSIVSVRQQRFQAQLVSSQNKISVKETQRTKQNTQSVRSSEVESAHNLTEFPKPVNPFSLHRSYDASIKKLKLSNQVNFSYFQSESSRNMSYYNQDLLNNSELKNNYSSFLQVDQVVEPKKQSISHNPEPKQLQFSMRLNQRQIFQSQAQLPQNQQKLQVIKQEQNVVQSQNIDIPQKEPENNEAQQNSQNEFQDVLQDYQLHDQKKQKEIQSITKLAQNYNFVIKDTIRKYFLDFAKKDIYYHEYYEDLYEFFKAFQNQCSQMPRHLIFKMLFDYATVEKKYIKNILQYIWTELEQIIIYAEKFQIKTSSILLQEMKDNPKLKRVKVIGYSMQAYEFQKTVKKILQQDTLEDFHMTINLIEFSQELIRILEKYRGRKQVQSRITLNKIRKEKLIQIFPERLQENAAVSILEKVLSEKQIQQKFDFLNKLLKSEEKIRYTKQIKPESVSYEIVFRKNIKIFELQQFFTYQWKQAQSISFQYIQIGKQICRCICDNPGSIYLTQKLHINYYDFYYSGVIYRQFVNGDLSIFESLKSVEFQQNNKFSHLSQNQNSFYSKKNYQIVIRQKRFVQKRKRSQKINNRRFNLKKYKERLRRYRKIDKTIKQFKQNKIRKKYPNINFIEDSVF